MIDDNIIDIHPAMSSGEFTRAVRTVSGESKHDSSSEIPREKGAAVGRTTTSRTASRTPSFFRLIRELRSRFPVERLIKSNLISYDEADGICHETGERLSHLDINRTRNENLQQQKGVKFAPHTLAVSALVESEAVELEDLLSSGSFDVNQIDENGDTLLHKAALEGDVECIRVLFKHGADVNIKNKDGWPAVHFALTQGNLSAMVYLVECGADMAEYTNLRVKEYRKIEQISQTVYKGEEIFV